MGLGDTLDRISILTMKLEETGDPDVGGELDKRKRELLQEIPESYADALITATRLGCINGMIWTINDWTRQHPQAFFYGAVQKLNDARRRQVEWLNKKR